MPSLAELQARFTRALLDDDASGVAAAVLGDGLAPEARIAIYRHHVVESLTAALRATYPVIHRLVGDGFFSFIARDFIGAHPPTAPCLFEYGDAFAAFLESHRSCRELAYLGDVARLEWALTRARHAGDAVSLSLETLRALDPDCVGDVVLGFEPSVTLLASSWAIDDIWRANQPDADPDAVVDARGAVRLEVQRRHDDVVFRRLDAPTYEFRRGLADGCVLAAAAEAARMADDGFDLATALRDVFTDNVLTSFRVRARSEEAA